MKKVVIETECGEETQFYVEQDVETITVDGEEWIKKTNDDEDEDVLEDVNIYFRHDDWCGHIIKVSSNGLEKAFDKLRTMGDADEDGSLIFVSSVLPEDLGYKE